MSDPYQAPHARLDGDPVAPPASRAATAYRVLGYVGTAVLSFALGVVVTVLVMVRVFAPPPDCPSPCDAPAYVAMGATILVGPIVGVLFAVASVYLLRRWWRRKSRAPA